MTFIVLLFSGFTIGISGAMIPGPLTLFTISEVLKINRFAGLKIISGHISLEFIFTLVIFFGLKGLIGSGPFLSIVSYMGGLALIIMGIVLMAKAPGMRMPDKKSDTVFGRGLFAGGVFFSIISPGFLVWWATVGLSSSVKALLYGIPGLACLALGRWSAVILWQYSLSYAVDKGKKYISDRAYRNIIRFFSLLLIILGVHFLTGPRPY